MAAAASSSSPTFPGQQKREVFLSFRGEDTRYNFTSHLYKALRGKAIDTFIDNNLNRGEEISTALLKTIEASLISIVVLSKNYASSSWCLNELSKIIECNHTYGQIVVPIFYHVDPSDVRKQTGSFAETFANYEERFKNNNNDKAERWRAALKEVSSLSGWHLQKDMSESELIEEIVEDISKKLIYKYPNDSNLLVGIDLGIMEIKSLLCRNSERVHIVGIWGMGGIGKTTISQAVFNEILVEFEGCCFLANVREESERHGRFHLQEKLLSKLLEGRNLHKSTGSLPKLERLRHKEVLIVLDDVHDARLLLDLLPKKHYFGCKSRIIITSRDKQVLQQVVDEIYEVKGLVDHDALRLFSLHAFKQGYPEETFMELAKMVVNYAKGVPLALQVLGSTLYGRSKQDWQSALNKLKKVLNPEIHYVLRISYDYLDDEVKDIFLDIACFFKGKNRNYITKILDGCYLSTYFGISVLIDKSLITISNNCIWMHDLLEEMGWNVARQESMKEPGKYSRLWIPDDVHQVLKNNTGTEVIEGIFLDMSKIKDVYLTPAIFARMYNLRLLKFYYSGLKRGQKLYLSQGLESISDKLSYFHWHGYPSKSLPPNFCAEKLVELIMPDSYVKRLWNGVQNLVKLKRLDLSHSQHLIEIPDLSRATCLEIMELQGCNSLVEIPSSIQYLNKLNSLDLEGCQNLRNLPGSIHLRSLRTLNLSNCSNITKCPEISGNLEMLYLDGTGIEKLPSSICKLKFLEHLILSGCSKLRSFPEILETMERLKYLWLDGTAIEELPSSIEHLVGLISLHLDYCKMLKNLPSSIWKFKSLKELPLSGCSNLKKLPEISGNTKWITEDEPSTSIEVLFLLCSLNLENCTELGSLPSSISKLKSLHSIDLSGCSKLESFPEISETMECLQSLCLEGTAIKGLSSSIQNLTGLVTLNLTNCNKLSSLPNTIGNMKCLVNLIAAGCSKLEELPENLENSNSLQYLCLSECNLLEFPSRLTCISSLRELVLSGNHFESIPASIKQLSQLYSLDLSYCKRLQFLPELPPHLNCLDAEHCTSLEAVSISSIVITEELEEYLPFTCGRRDAFIFTNCLKMNHNASSNIVAEAQLRIHNRATAEVENHHNMFYLESSLTICIPGSTIPDWFSHQSTGSCVTTLLPPHWLGCKFVGFALCAVVAFNDYNDDSGFTVRCQSNFKSKYGDCHSCFCSFLGWGDQEGNPRFVDSDHIFLGYDFNLYCNWFSGCHLNEASFEFCASDLDGNPLDCCKVKKCGVQLLYAQDKLSLKCGVINEDFEEPMGEDGTIIKRYHDDYSCNDAKPSRNFSRDEEEEELHAKN